MRAAAGETEAAAIAFSRSCEIEPDRASALGALSHAFSALSRWDDGVKAARAAIALRPDDIDLHVHLGNLLMQAGAPGEAASAYRQAIALGRTGEDAERQLAEALRVVENLSETPSTAAPAPLAPEPTTPSAPLTQDAPSRGLLRRIFGGRHVFGQ